MHAWSMQPEEECRAYCLVTLRSSDLETHCSNQCPVACKRSTAASQPAAILGGRAELVQQGTRTSVGVRGDCRSVSHSMAVIC
jgi:hypothetical protein